MVSRPLFGLSFGLVVVGLDLGLVKFWHVSSCELISRSPIDHIGS